MNRYNNYGLAQPHASAPNNFSQNFKSERHDDRASLSGSEDSNYGLYADTHKTEADIEGAFYLVNLVHRLFFWLSF